jgi:hypothetical protein
MTIKPLLFGGQTVEPPTRIDNIGEDALDQREHLPSGTEVENDLFFTRFASGVAGPVGRVAHGDSRCMRGRVEPPSIAILESPVGIRTKETQISVVWFVSIPS